MCLISFGKFVPSFDLMFFRWKTVAWYRALLAKASCKSNGLGLSLSISSSFVLSNS